MVSFVLQCTPLMLPVAACRRLTQAQDAHHNMDGPNSLKGVAITGPVTPEYEVVLTPEALSFVAHLARCFTPRVTELLKRRVAVQVRLSSVCSGMHATRAAYKHPTVQQSTRGMCVPELLEALRRLFQMRFFDPLACAVLVFQLSYVLCCWSPARGFMAVCWRLTASPAHLPLCRRDSTRASGRTSCRRPCASASPTGRCAAASSSPCRAHAISSVRPSNTRSAPCRLGLCQPVVVGMPAAAEQLDVLNTVRLDGLCASTISLPDPPVHAHMDRWRPSPRTLRTGGARSRAPWTARWSSMRSTAAPMSTWPTSRTPTRPPGAPACKTHAHAGWAFVWLL